MQHEALSNSSKQFRVGCAVSLSFSGRLRTRSSLDAASNCQSDAAETHILQHRLQQVLTKHHSTGRLRARSSRDAASNGQSDAAEAHILQHRLHRC